MKITQQFETSDKLRTLTQKEKVLGKMVYQQCFAIQPTESVLILADPGKFTEAKLLFEAAKAFTSRVKLVMFDGMTENAQEPTAQIVKHLMQNDVALLVTTYSLSHTRGRQRASEGGARIASLPGITEEMMVRTLSADYKKITSESERLATILTQAKKAILTSPGGTSLTFSLEGRRGIADTGMLQMQGAFGNLPAGEAFLAPVEGTTEGTLVVDGCLADIALDSPITIDIRNGNATKIRGKKAARELEAAMQAVGDASRVVAELGIGTNECARVDSDVLEAEKVFGTCHIAFGDNAGFGGTNDVPFHTDGVILRPTLVCDDIVVMKDGVFM